ncbi:hypothetical protein CSE899_12436 [Cronobacter sakazakii E899]|nr:hypothetical protein CSE899_12436 [Cronobacter sakazakii E899]
MTAKNAAAQRIAGIKKPLFVSGFSGSHANQ